MEYEYTVVVRVDDSVGMTELTRALEAAGFRVVTVSRFVPWEMPDSDDDNEDAADDDAGRGK